MRRPHAPVAPSCRWYPAGRARNVTNPPPAARPRHRLVAVGTMLAALALVRPAEAAAVPSAQEIVTTEAGIAAAMYGDALAAGETLRRSVLAFLAEPSAPMLDAARAAWIAAREPYEMAASLGFASPRTAAWQRRVDAWPIEPGLIDYTAAPARTGENPFAHADVIGRRAITIGGRTVMADEIDRRLLAALQDADGIPTNVAAGYHVVEFLLWGEGGRRPAGDYARDACAHDDCGRRRAYLRLATDLLVEDLGRIATDWAAGGSARAALLAEPPAQALAALFTAFGDESFQSLAGERLKLSLVLHDDDAAEDCFSGAAAADFVAAERGLAALYRGHYRSARGAVVAGPGIAALGAARAPDQAAAVEAAMTAAAEALEAIAAAAESAGGYGRLIAPRNAAGSRLIGRGIHALFVQARAGESLAKTLGVETRVEGGDRLAAPPPPR
ncbi:MAG TPA: imelysin family protein [Hyphomicrobiales bacterium]|nr:imelysin family protein [Hyphomicrobiales bacterium]